MIAKLIWDMFAVFGIITGVSTVLRWIYCVYLDWKQERDLTRWKKEAV